MERRFAIGLADGDGGSAEEATPVIEVSEWVFCVVRWSDLKYCGTGLFSE